MTNEIANIDNKAAMMKLMGVTGSGTDSKSSTLARLRIANEPIMGEAEVKGKMTKVEVVPAGQYQLEITEGDGSRIYSDTVTIRPFVWRMMYKRFVKGMGDTPNRYIKTIMHDKLTDDLKDNAGGFNCGRPSGYIKDWSSLNKETQDLIKSVKRVRVLFGLVTLNNPVDATGQELDSADFTDIPFIYEIENKDAFKTTGEVVNTFSKKNILPPQVNVTATTEEHTGPKMTWYTPKLDVDYVNQVEITTEDQVTFGNFADWVVNYNQYITNQWMDNRTSGVSPDDAEVIEAFTESDDEIEVEA